MRGSAISAAHVRPLGHAHRAARFVDRDRHAELLEGLDEGAHRRA
ncbi:hypothetical protein OKW46_005235 [Paraburkholderia sp. WSM4179]|nr:hypothetical protein [Paraburkholderia sp. WSM4179]